MKWPKGRQVVAAFDGGDNTSDANALLLGATDRVIGLVGRFAACFVDDRAQAQVEHTIEGWWHSGCSASPLATRT
jgi:hypothetical protein